MTEKLTPHAYAMEYELRADEGDYTPSDGERVMIEDAICGYLAVTRTPSPQAHVVGWQPIATAPLDKTSVIIAVPTKHRDDWIIGEASYDPDHEGGDWWWAGMAFGDYAASPISDCNYHAPEYWQPLPMPPALAAREGQP